MYSYTKSIFVFLYKFLRVARLAIDVFNYKEQSSFLCFKKEKSKTQLVYGYNLRLNKVQTMILL